MSPVRLIPKIKPLRKSIRVLPVLATLLLTPSVCQAGFWQTFQEKCTRLFKNSSPTEVQNLTLPPRFSREIRYPPSQYLAKWKQELWVSPLDPALRPLIAKVRTQAQYEVLRRLAGKPLKSLEIKWTIRYFDRFNFIEHSAAFARDMGNEGVTYSEEFDERIIDSIFNISTKDQFALYISSEQWVKVGVDNYFRAEAIPRVSNSFQRDALRILMRSSRNQERDIINLALLITNPEQLKAYEYGLDAGISFLELRPLLKIKTEAGYRKFKETIDALRDPIEEGLPNAEKIAANVRADFWVSSSGYTITDNTPGARTFSVRMEEKGAVGDYLFPEPNQNNLFPLSEDPWVREATTFSERLNQKKPTSFAYTIFNREHRRRGKFDTDFISYLKDEDRVLPYERITLFELQNTDSELIGVFGLFDATPIPSLTDDALPFVRKRPHLEGKMREKIATWKAELGGSTPRVFEVRRLALHPNASQVNLETVIRIIRAQCKSLGISNESYIIAHTDHAGSAIFQRKAKMHPLFSPEELKNGKEKTPPDEYVLFARVSSDWDSF